MSKPSEIDAAETSLEAARGRLAATGRNDLCPCGSGKKYKKCHLMADEGVTAPTPKEPDADQMIANGWRMFEQRRPGAAEKEFRNALKLKPANPDAVVGVGMARLSAGDTEGALKELAEVVKSGEEMAAELHKSGVKDAFARREAQSYVRACHALGCLAYDQARYEDAVKDLERVYSIDDGTVGTEARLIAGKTLVRLGRASEAVSVLEEAAKTEMAGSRAQLGLALAHFGAGNRSAAEKALHRALQGNPHYGKALLGQIRKSVDALVGAPAGSREEALIYAQTYGDVWDEPAKAFLAEVVDGPVSQVKTQVGSPLAADEAPPAAG